MQNNKRAFSFVEIIITISIIVLLAVVWLSINQGQSNKTDNTKIRTDIQTINNVLESYSQENSTLPTPWGNTNYFTNDWSYLHDIDSEDSFWIYGSFTDKTIPKRYLNITPIDPKTNSYYSYGKTIDSIADIAKTQFELAWVLNIDEQYQAIVEWNYTAEIWLYNLIRSYNSSNFVNDRSISNLPYNPEELILTTTASWVVYYEWDTITANSSDLEIFFSDGSVSILEAGSEITLTKLDFPNGDNLNSFVKLALWAWTIWTKATHLDEQSEFQIYTTDTTAAVRGTIFWVSKDLSWNTEVLVVEWEVEILKNEDNSSITTLEQWESTSVKEWVEKWDSTLDESDIENKFSAQVDIRSVETLKNINDDIALVETDEPNMIIEDESVVISVPDVISCTPSDNELNWIIKTITCDSDNNEIINYSCTDSTKELNLDNTACKSTIPTLDWLSLHATADYNSIWDFDFKDNDWNSLYTKDFPNVFSPNNSKDLPSICKSWSKESKSFCKMSSDNWWIFIDDSDNDDFIKYSNLNLDSDFIIEVKVKIPTDNNTHYLIHSLYGIKLYTIGSRLYFNENGSDDYINITQWAFNTIRLKNISWKMTVESGGNISSNKTDVNIGSMYIWTFYDSDFNYFKYQINDIIDYVEIYKN